jgi:putative CocE/NonD family hydrolase
MLDGISQGANKLGLEIARDFTTQGYVLVWQDCRGTGRSKGNWDPYIHEGKDGLDLVKWVRGQSWSNGKVTMFGGSYCGFTQLAAATQAGKSLCAILPEVPVFNWYDINYTGGAFRLDSTIFWSTLMVRPRFGEHSPMKVDTSRFPWKFSPMDGREWSQFFRHLPLVSWDELIGLRVPWMPVTLGHPEFDDSWKTSSTREGLEQVPIPCLIITGWYDLFLNQALRYFPQLRHKSGNPALRPHQHLIIGPWEHFLGQPIGELNFGKNLGPEEVSSLRKQWYARWLKEEKNQVASWPFLRLFVMGDNYWRDEQEWPLARTRFTPFYFHSEGSANTRSGNGRLKTTLPNGRSEDRYVYDPGDPVPTLGGFGGLVDRSGPSPGLTNGRGCLREGGGRPKG